MQALGDRVAAQPTAPQQLRRSPRQLRRRQEPFTANALAEAPSQAVPSSPPQPRSSPTQQQEPLAVAALAEAPSQAGGPAPQPRSSPTQQQEHLAIAALAEAPSQAGGPAPQPRSSPRLRHQSRMLDGFELNAMPACSDDEGSTAVPPPSKRARPGPRSQHAWAAAAGQKAKAFIPFPPRLECDEDVQLLHILVPDGKPAPKNSVEWMRLADEAWNPYVDHQVNTGVPTLLRHTNGAMLKDFYCQVQQRRARHNTLHPAAGADQAAARFERHEQRQQQQQHATAAADTLQPAHGGSQRLGSAQASGGRSGGSGRHSNGGGRGGAGKIRLCSGCRLVVQCSLWVAIECGACILLLVFRCLAAHCPAAYCYALDRGSGTHRY